MIRSAGAFAELLAHTTAVTLLLKMPSTEVRKVSF